MDSPCNRYFEECEVCSEVLGEAFGEAFEILTRRSLFSFYMQKSWHGLSRGIEVQGKYECGCLGSSPLDPGRLGFRSDGAWWECGTPRNDSVVPAQ